MTEGFTGTGVALVTPFREDNGIDFAALEKVVDHVINGGVEYLVVLGTTGETATLPEKEKVEVIHAIKEMNNGRVPVVLGIGGNNTAEVVESVTKTDLSGIDAILSVAP